MKAVVTAALLGLALTGCTDDSKTEAMLKRSQIVKVCPGGIYVGRDPKTGDIFTYERGVMSDAIGTVQPGVTASEVC